jgi:uncharacterized membrane protein YkvA (DUF1232 family)
MDNQNKDIKMTSDLSKQVKEIGFWREIVHQVRLVFHLLRDPEVPFYLKLVPFIGFVYLLSPIDFVPDFFLGLGQLDDLTVLLVGSKIFMELAPPHIVARHRQAIRTSDGFTDSDGIKESIIIDGEHQTVAEAGEKTSG